jgi:hypothetical protein
MRLQVGERRGPNRLVVESCYSSAVGSALLNPLINHLPLNQQLPHLTIKEKR